MRLVFALLLLPLLAMAHDVPNDVTMHVYLKPQITGGQAKMQVLVRVPVNSLIDFLFPMTDDGVFLDLKGTNPQTPDAARVWVSDLLNIYEGETLLPHPTILKTLVSRKSDPSFDTYAGAIAHINGPPLPDSALVAWDRAALDVLLETPIHSVNSDFSLVPRYGRLGVRVTNMVTFLPPGGGQRYFEYEGDPPRYQLNPSALDAARHFAALGFTHIRAESDHLLLLLAVTLLLRTAGGLLPFILTFSAAHSAALLGAALLPGASPLWLPRVAGTLMAVSIVYLCLDNAFPTTPERYRPLVALVAGLVYGAGFWYFLEPALQYGGAHPAVAALAFNLGLEAGQFVALGLIAAAVALFFRFASPQPGVSRMWTLVFSGYAAHLAWHRMTERAFLLSDLPAAWPSPAVWAAILSVAASIIFIESRRKTISRT